MTATRIIVHLDITENVDVEIEPGLYYEYLHGEP